MYGHVWLQRDVDPVREVVQPTGFGLYCIKLIIKLFSYKSMLLLK